MKSRFLCPILLLILLTSTIARAQWVNNGIPLVNAPFVQGFETIVPDGSGGAIVIWQDRRSGAGDYDIYAQRTDAFGNALWALNGVPIIIATNDQTNIVATTDGAGGAIIMWADNRAGNADIYAQRVSASGTLLWPVLGAAINTIGSSIQIPTSVIPDGSGGAIVSFNDGRNLANADLYAQRINAAGVTQWAGGGVAVSVGAGDQYASVMAPDGAGGAIVTWTDSRAGSTNLDIYAQRMSAGGVAQWAANGVAVCTATGSQDEPSIIADGANGVILTWEDNRGVWDIFAQRLNSSGTALWTLNGVIVSSASNNQFTPVLVSDGNQGAIIAWYDNRSGTYNEYAQRVNAAGSPVWTGDGVPVCTAAGTKDAPSIASDGTGGAFIVWQDTRNGADIYAQHVTVSGTTLWTTDGIPVCSANASQYTQVATGDGAGNIIVAWADERATPVYSDIFAQRMEGTFGYWGHPEPKLTSVADIRGDQGGKVALNWQASQRDVSVPRTISYYDVWRAVDALPYNMTIGAPSVITNLNDVREDTKRPLYYAAPATTSSPPYYWELVGTQGAHGFGGYSFAADTRADSVAAGAHNEAFMVSAHIAGDDYVAFTSNVFTGHSVDNLAPPAPLFLSALRVSADVHLKWNGVHVADLKNYTVYRATATGVTPIPVNFLANDTDTVLVDAGAPGNALYYIVTANDVHGNQGTKSNEASVAATTGVGNLPPITALTVLQNHPNPFTGETQLNVGLPAKSDVRLDIYDVAGRRVREVTMNAQAKGWNTLRIDAHDDRGTALPSGVYFFRVHAGAETVTKKMVIAR
jgi:hypothetical protein